MRKKAGHKNRSTTLNSVENKEDKKLISIKFAGNLECLWKISYLSAANLECYRNERRKLFEYQEREDSEKV